MGKAGYIFWGLITILYIFGVIRCIFYAVNAKKIWYTIFISSFLILALTSFAIIKIFDSKDASIIVEVSVYSFFACNIIVFVLGYICERAYKKIICKPDEAESNHLLNFKE